MGLKLNFEIELCSDYHVSAGHGLGALVDSALHRDADGMPMLRGTTVTGLLRDGLYRLLQLQPLHAQGRVVCQASGLPESTGAPRFCGQHDPQQPDCPVCRLFGSPRTIKRWRIGSARPAGLPEPLADGWSPGQAGGKIAPHVRINPRTRRAEARKLFFREEGDARLRFRFCAECDADDQEALEEAEWLVAGARFVRHLGASRRRGRGQCTIHLLETGTSGSNLPALAGEASYEEWLLSRFEQHQLKRQSRPPTLVEPLPFVLSQATSGTPLHIVLVARLDEPLLISEKAEAGNEFRTVEHVPGSTLRGALANRVAARFDLEKQAGDAYAAFVRLFSRDRVQFLPFYPAHRVRNEIHPALPAPRDLLSCELYPGFAGEAATAAHGAKGFALSADLHPTCPVCQDKQDVYLKPLGGFLGLRDKPDHVELKRVTEMHVHIDPATGRAASGDLYGFDTLAPGQYLMGQINCTDAAAWEDLCALADLPREGGSVTIRLGKANRRGYGQVTLWFQRLQEGGESPWRLLELGQRVSDPQAPLTMTLLTDTILVDSWGRFQTGFDSDWLSATLGTRVKVKRSFCASRTVDGFHAYLGLPRWRDVALQAGSAVGLELQEALALDELQRRLEKAEQQGIGLRRNEGFGQIAFNHPLYDGCRRVQDGARLRLPRDLRLAEGGKDHQLQVETQFRQDWAYRLTGQNWKAFRWPEFESVARLLRAQAPASVQEVKDLSECLGHSDELLPAALVKDELAVWEGVKGKLNFFRGGAGQDGLNRLAELAALLKQEAGSDRHRWRIGLEMLADRIAHEAGSKRRT